MSDETETELTTASPDATAVSTVTEESGFLGKETEEINTHDDSNQSEQPIASSAGLIDDVESTEESSNERTLMERLLSLLTQQWFILGLVLCVILAVSVPWLGKDGGIFYPEITASWIGVILIFLFSGLSVKTTEVWRVTKFWQCNLLIQSSVFIAFPVYGFLLTVIVKSMRVVSSNALLKGTVILCCLPTTISSAVVLTVNSDGSDTVSIINTALSNILGIVITPLLLLIFVGSFGSDIGIGDIFFKLFFKVVLPFGFGQIVRHYLFKPGSQALSYYNETLKPRFKLASQLLLLFIVFNAMSDSIASGIDAKVLDIVVIFLLCLITRVLSLLAIWHGCRLINHYYDQKKQVQLFSLADRIAILFCATQKTAAFGVPLIDTLYGDTDKVGLFLVPLLLYHPMQLVIDSFLSPWFKKMVHERNNAHSNAQLSRVPTQPAL